VTPPEVSVVITTFNRHQSLAQTIASILAQANTPEFELIVVDNRSTDETRSVIHRYAAQDNRVRYVFEPQQGMSYGRNAGIALARAALIAFTDDDVVVSPNWLCSIKNAFEAHPNFGCVGGKVLPRWPAPPPTWLTPRQWGPLALVDYGEAQAIDAVNRRCLISANMAVRADVFQQIGGFIPAFQKASGSVSGLEDRELQERYWRTGGRCWFDPSIVAYAAIQPERLEKRYHRRWHFNHGEAHAALRDAEFEASGWRFQGIPGHVIRRFVSHSLQSQRAFEHELEARFMAGFIRGRHRQRTASAAAQSS
jgi:glucosyl-dolichyl phosphate glucuronosyltransferase